MPPSASIPQRGRRPYSAAERCLIELPIDRRRPGSFHARGQSRLRAIIKLSSPEQSPSPVWLGTSRKRQISSSSPHQRASPYAIAPTDAMHNKSIERTPERRGGSHSSGFDRALNFRSLHPSALVASTRSPIGTGLRGHRIRTSRDRFSLITRPPALGSDLKFGIGPLWNLGLPGRPVLGGLPRQLRYIPLVHIRDPSRFSSGSVMGGATEPPRRASLTASVWLRPPVLGGSYCPGFRPMGVSGSTALGFSFFSAKPGKIPPNLAIG